MSPNKLEFVIITGMSGSGKTVAMQSFEDMGYYTVDNMPPNLLPMFIELLSENGHFSRVCVVVDLRSREFFFDSKEILSDIDENPAIDTQIIYLDASDEALVSRYKESRRNHPLATDQRVIDGITQERELLKDILQINDDYYDTSNLTPRELRQKLMKKYLEKSGTNQFRIEVISFGFKNGVPIDADLMFDVRFLPNPHYIEELRPQTGQDAPVYDYVMAQPQTETFFKLLSQLLDFSVPLYKKEGKTSLTIGIGCTGGHHRSVALAERLGRKLIADGYKVNVTHRDIHQRKESTVRS